MRVRCQRWRVVGVRAFDACGLVTLSGLDAENLGVERRYLTPFDAIEPAELPRGLQVSRMQTWSRACRALLAARQPPAGLRTPRRARIDLLPHQLEPAMAIVRGLGSRVLLADEVGLGKTIQAALVVAELRARDAADRVLVLTPAGLRDQWQEELAERFGLAAAVVDAPAVRARGAALPVGVNPWATTPIAIASLDYVKRAEVLPSVRACRWDVVIVDEAHTLGGGSDRLDAAAALASRAAFVLLLSATPHGGDRRSFASLCGIGARADPLLLFRRTRDAVGGGTRRRVHRLLVRPSRDEARMHRQLARFAALVVAEHGPPSRAMWLALSVLHKRAFSSAQSLGRTVARRLRALDAAPAAEALQLALPLDDEGERDGADEAPEWPAELTLGDTRRERQLLTALGESARAAADEETKLAALARLLRRIAEPVIVFTEYRDTLVRLQEFVPGSAALHGGLSRAERRAIVERFSSGACAVLLATDAAGQGLNLHRACRVVVNLELPWSPTRLEQRIGRVDRIGQRRAVHAVHLIARGTGEMRVLERLRAKLAAARGDIGAADSLGEGDEAATAREVCGRRTDQETQTPAEHEAARPDAVAVDLSASAAGEASRVESARRLLARSEDDPPWLASDGPRLAWPRARRARTALGSRLLAIVRVACDDGCGRRVDWTLVPLAIALAPGARIRDRAQAEAVWRHVANEALRAARDATLAWREEAVRLAAAFAAARVARERAIAIDAGAGPTIAFQPGLFDRRAERVRVVLDAEAAEQSAEDAARLTMLEQAAIVRAAAPELLLMLAP